MTHVVVTPPISAAVGGTQLLRGLCEEVHLTLYILVGTRRAASSYQPMCIAFDDAARRVPTSM